jgi:hypothetical protein
MKKVIISESQLEKVRNLIYKLFDQRLYPVEGWQNVGHQIRRDNEKVGFHKKDGFGHYKGETFISTAEEPGYYNYYGCEFIKLMGLEEDTECPCLMLQDDDYDFFGKRFPADLWKPLLVDWWNEQCEYPVEDVYKY